MVDIETKKDLKYEICQNTLVDLVSLGLTSSCEARYIHVKVYDIKSLAEKMIGTIQSTSWISNMLDDDLKQSYQKCSEITIKNLVADIFKKVENKVTSEFGEYLVSCTAQYSLQDEHQHHIFPLAEIWKEDISKNPGFDFHTYSPGNILFFGEAKYNAKNSPWGKALESIIDFIKLGKEIQEYIHLKNLYHKVNSIHKQNSNKAFIAAFSINAVDPENVFNNVLKSDLFPELLMYPELFLIGIEVCQ